MYMGTLLSYSFRPVLGRRFWMVKSIGCLNNRGRRDRELLVSFIFSDEMKFGTGSAMGKIGVRFRTDPVWGFWDGLENDLLHGAISPMLWRYLGSFFFLVDLVGDLQFVRTSIQVHYVIQHLPFEKYIKVLEIELDFVRNLNFFGLL